MFRSGQGGGIVYAVINVSGRQQRVEEGKYIKIDKLAGEKGAEVEFDEILLINNDGQTTVGQPFVKNAKVQGKIIEHGKDSKIIVFKFKAKKDYRRKQGHRQPYSKVMIEKIVLPS